MTPFWPLFETLDLTLPGTPWLKTGIHLDPFWTWLQIITLKKGQKRTFLTLFDPFLTPFLRPTESVLSQWMPYFNQGALKGLKKSSKIRPLFWPFWGCQTPKMVIFDPVSKPSFQKSTWIVPRFRKRGSKSMSKNSQKAVCDVFQGCTFRGYHKHMQ